MFALVALRVRSQNNQRLPSLAATGEETTSSAVFNVSCCSGNQPIVGEYRFRKMSKLPVLFEAKVRYIVPFLAWAAEGATFWLRAVDTSVCDGDQLDEL